MFETPETQPEAQRAVLHGSATAAATLGRVAIVCAMEREVAGFIAGLRVEEIWHAFKRYRLYEGGRATVIVAGIGATAARYAAELALERSHADVLVSAGFAGETAGGLEIGGPYTAAKVVDAATGREYKTLFGAGVLASAGAVLGREAKKELFERYGARAVDMEAAAVAEVAERNGVGFLAVKSISDLHDFPMPPLDRFVDGKGEFHTGRFAAWMLVRPQVWGTVRRLNRNSARAAETLNGVLGSLLRYEDLRRVKLGAAELRPRENASR